MRYKAVCIDVDNTLIDFNKCAQLCFKQAFAETGLKYKDEYFDVFKTVNDGLWLSLERREITKKKLFEVRFERIFNRLGIDTDGPAFEKVFKKYLFDASFPVEDSLYMLEYLYGKYPLYAMTNGSLDQQNNRLEKIDYLKFFNKVYASAELGYNKPDSRFFEACFNDMEIDPQDTVLIGDSLSADIEGGRSAGMHTVWFNYDNRSDYTGYEPEMIIGSLKEIKEYL